MRTAFMRELTALAEHDSSITFVTGDLGFSVIEDFAQRFGSQFLNVGVAEQNMTGIAAGMALCGRVVFTYSIANFPTIRCLEQVRNDVCYQRANVKIVAVGGGLAYGNLGYTHHAVEDLAIVRALPGMTVVAPGDPLEAAAATRAVASTPGPCYLRLGKSGEPVVHSPGLEFELGRAIAVREGADVTIVSTGGILPTAVEVAERLERDGIEARVLSMHTLTPLDEKAILGAAEETSAIVALEEHSVVGGLGSAVAEVLAGSTGAKAPFRHFGLPPEPIMAVGSAQHLRERYGLTAERICPEVRDLLQTHGKGPRRGPLR